MLNIFRKKPKLTSIDEQTLQALRKRVCWLESARIQGIITGEEFDCEMALIDLDLSKLEEKYE